MNIQHSSRSDEWYTPDYIIEKVRSLLGTIDFDPASSTLANAKVQACKFFTKDDDALTTEWLPGTLFCNPPGGKIKNKSKTALFWEKLMCWRESGNLTHGVFLAFSLEALQTSQGKGCKAIGEFPFCVPKSRIKFVLPNGSIPTAPSHSNVLVYVPGTVDKTEEFYNIFSALGNVINTRRHP